MSSIYKLILILVFIYSHTAMAQVKYRDRPIVDSYVQALYDKGDPCLKQVSDSCRQYYTEALAYGKKNNVAFLDFLYFQLGHYYDVRQQYDSAIHYQQIAWKHIDFKDTNSAYKLIVNSLGANYFRMANYDSAAHYMMLSIQAAEYYGKPRNLVYTYNNFATLLGINEQHEEAIKYYIKGYNILDSIQDTTIIANIASNTSIQYDILKIKDSAIFWAQKAVDYGTRYNNPSAESYGYYTLAKSTNDLQLSLQYFEKAKQLATENQYYDVLADVLSLYAVKLAKIGSISSAKEYIEEAILQHKKIFNTTGLLSAYKNAADVYTASKEYAKANEYYKMYYTLYEDNIAEENKKRIANVNAKYQNAKKEKLIAEQALSIEQKNSSIRKWIFTVSSVLLISIIAFWVYRNTKSKQLAQLEQEKENAVLKALMNGEERERNRISKDLHDGVAAMLGAVKMSLHSIPHLPEEQRLPQLNKVAELVGKTHVDVRRIAHDLLPLTLEREGLIPALLQFASDINQMGIVQISVRDNIKGKLELLPRTALMLYRIVQELINNIIKHSEASEAIIAIEYHDELLKIAIKDNGIGFNNEAESQGLHSIKERLKVLGGSFNINAKKNIGTQAELSIRLHQN